MKTKPAIMFLSCLVLFYILSMPVVACPPPPPPPPPGCHPPCDPCCEDCVNGRCVVDKCWRWWESCCCGKCYGFETQYCCNCKICEMEDYHGQCCNNECCNDGCCDDKTCYDPNTKHCCIDEDGHTCNDNETCCDGDCCDNLTQKCCDDIGGDNDGYCCSENQCCNNGECSNNCWTIENVPAYAEVCPDCQPLITGCEGIIEIRNGYYEWRPAGSGEGGWCKNPTKPETVGFLFECTEDWDLDLLAVCSASVALCVYACETHPYVCAACLVLQGAACVLEGGICTFVDTCTPVDAIQPVEKDVIDTGADWGGLCIGG